MIHRALGPCIEDTSHYTAVNHVSEVLWLRACQRMREEFYMQSMGERQMQAVEVMSKTSERGWLLGR